jgi:hypothetical protein
MHRQGPFLLAAVVAAVIGLTAVVSVQQAQEDGRALPGQDWPLVGGDWTSARYSTLRQIDTQNVTKLGGAWTKTFESTRATPVVKDGQMFVPAGALLRALDENRRHILDVAASGVVFGGRGACATLAQGIDFRRRGAERCRGGARRRPGLHRAEGRPRDRGQPENRRAGVG